jgi:hypothetical protein
VGHPNTGNAGPDYGIGQAQGSGQHLARAAEPEERNSQNQLFHPGYLDGICMDSGGNPKSICGAWIDPETFAFLLFNFYFSRHTVVSS